MTVTIRKGDCREVLRTLADESVHCVVTSPPYWGLRDYGTAAWEGGDAGCDHLPPRDDVIRATMAQTGLNTAKNGLSENQMAAASARMAKSPCPKCGARRIDSQLGLEPTYQEYVANMVEVFREVRRVLRNDGTLWLNLGDSYAGRGHGGGGSYDAERNWRQGAIPGEGGQQNGSRNRDGLGRIIGLKPKDLCGIPWRVAFALQADGWYLRQDIIWSKPNPMPESVRDRCTKAHEYIFLLSKGARYYYDAEAIAEDSIRPGDVQTFGGAKACHSEILEGDPRFRNGAEQWGRTIECGNTRNRRSVWEIAIAPFSEAHFATFPPALIEPCIMAGCPKDGTVFDPFGGAGTTGLVADRLGRNAILIELNPEYAEMAEHRIKNDAGMFAEVTCGPIR